MLKRLALGTGVQNRRALPRPLFLIAFTGVCSASFHSLYPLFSIAIAYSDIPTKIATAIGPGLPYIDKLIEYPVLTGLFIRFMGFLGQSEWPYYVLSSLFLTLFAVVSTFFLYRTISNKVRPRLFTYWVLAPSMLIFLVYNWDIMAVLFVVIAFYFITRGRDCSASAFLALGASCKFYAVMYLLPLLMRKRSISQWTQIIGVFGLTTFAINTYFALSNFDGWYYFFDVSRWRGPNLDSIWGLFQYYIPQLSVSQINLLSTLIFAISAAILAWKLRHESTVKLCFVLTLLFLLSNKVFSPQFAIWLLPFFVLLPLAGTNKRLFYALELSNLMVLFTFLTYYFISEQNSAYLHICHLFVIIRHIVMIYVLIRVVRTRVAPQAMGTIRGQDAMGVELRKVEGSHS